MNIPIPTPKPWYKNWKILTPLIIVLLLIGFIAGQAEEEPAPTASEEPAAQEEQTPTWQRTDSYKDFCTGEPKIADELKPIVESATIPEGGHVWMANFNTDSDNPGMNTVFFALCSNADGDDLREVAEVLAIEVRESEHGDTISEMGVNASYANTSDTQTIVRDHDFQSRTHDGGESFTNGSYRAAWEYLD